MIISNIFKRIKISSKTLFDNIKEHCFLLLAILACSSGFFTPVFYIIEHYIRVDIRMDQAPNDQNQPGMAEDENIEMVVDDHDLEEFDDDDDDDLDDDLMNEPYVSDEESEDDDDQPDSSDSDNDCNMNNAQLNSVSKLEKNYITFEERACSSKPLYRFRPFTLMRDIFLNMNGSDAIPAARSGHRIIADSGNLYALGGFNPRSAMTAARDGRCMLFQELWSYNFATKRWKIVMTGITKPNMPQELVSNALVMYNNVLISFGGTGYPFGESCSNDIYVYSTDCEKPLLARLPVSGELPAALYGPAIVIHEDYLYTIGGTTGFDYYCDVFRLNLKTRHWQSMYLSRPEMRDDPEGRYRHEIVYDGNFIYVLGGGTSHTVYDLQRIPAFNLKTNRWDFFDTSPDRTLMLGSAAPAADVPEHIVGFPKPRKCFSCVQHKMDNGDIEAFISGGLKGDSATYFDDVWKLNLRTMQWSLIRTAKLPKALYFHSAADNENGLMYIFGGIEYDVKDMRRRNRVYKMWMTIPKLSEICWEAITYYNDHLGTYNANALLSYGIPKRFADRVQFIPESRQLSSLSDSDNERPSMSCTAL